MYDVAAMVTTATPTELKLTGNWPVDWLQAPGYQIHRNSAQTSGERKLGLAPCCCERRGNSWQPSQLAKFALGDRVIVRCFFPGESR